MSRTPIREAMNALRREGLVVVIPRRGTFVKAVDIGELQDTYRMRALLEPEAAVLASQRATPAELDALAELSGSTVRTEDGSATMNEANRLFHVRIAELARIPVMAQAINALHEEIERFLNLQGALGHPYTATNHHRLVDIIRTESADEIRAVVRSGIEKARVHMIETLLARSDLPGVGTH
ncbi:GntR family transcriptional regulator [Saccharopolyspora erythraea]|uniref:GntR family transcriptional regulator n=1 Tax=Saccharopolyspora erythraea TaxID=1836 RepID=UPI001BA54DE5|nr:GntR family transcriptional regulator [Saccharopolyspora erythraea]QUH06279.1 GntR family transcriptional regulator [Saccharopolyspora erythraea]